MNFKNVIIKFLVFLLLILGILISNQVSFGQEEKIDANTIYNKENYKYEFVPGQVIIVLKNGDKSVYDTSNFLGIDGSIEELTNTKNPKNMLVKNSTVEKKISLLRLKKKGKQDVLDAIEKLKNNSIIEYAEPDYIVHIEDTVPNDPDFNKLWGMKKISAPQAWDKCTGSSSVIVGVIDTGIDYNHPDLKDNMWKNPGEIPGNGKDDDGNGFIDDVYGWDFANNDNDPTDDHFHGTHVAGTITSVGNNGVGVVGVTWKSKLAALKFLDKNGSGAISNAIKAIDYATKMGIPITNNSWSGGPYTQALKDVIIAGGLFIAAAGNNGKDNDSNPVYPSSYDCDNIIAVAATDSNDNLASFSCYGKTAVDIAAPGVDIWSCKPGNQYQYLRGTSMATPHVSGAAALLKSYNSSLSTVDLKTALLNGVDKLSQLSEKCSSGGRLNVYKALMISKCYPIIRPNFNLTGIWKNQWNDDVHVFQDGLDVYFTYVNGSFSHYFQGRYLAPNVVEGTIVRKNRNDGTITSLVLIWQIQSNNRIHHTAHLLNSSYHNDLPVNFSEDVTFSRVK